VAVEQVASSAEHSWAEVVERRRRRRRRRA
jgi:hypothetical protein